MGQQLLTVSGFVLFFLVLAAHFGSKTADWRDRPIAAIILAGVAFLAAVLVVPWECLMYFRDGLAVRLPLAAAWAIVGGLLCGRLLGLIRERRKGGY